MTYVRCKKANKSLVENVMQSQVSTLRNINDHYFRFQIKATPQRGWTMEDQLRSKPNHETGEIFWLKELVGFWSVECDGCSYWLVRGNTCRLWKYIYFYVKLDHHKAPQLLFPVQGIPFFLPLKTNKKKPTAAYTGIIFKNSKIKSFVACRILAREGCRKAHT